MANLRTATCRPATGRYGEAGSWLRELRSHWQITQAELAEQAGIDTAATVAWIEAGEIRLPRAFYAAYAMVFGMGQQQFGDGCDRRYALAEAKAA